VFNLHFSTENDNNFGYEKIMIVVDNMPLSNPLEIYIQGLEPRKADQVLFQVLPLFSHWSYGP
jgi:hypothetical protein